MKPRQREQTNANILRAESCPSRPSCRTDRSWWRQRISDRTSLQLLSLFTTEVSLHPFPISLCLSLSPSLLSHNALQSLSTVLHATWGKHNWLLGCLPLSGLSDSVMHGADGKLQCCTESSADRGGGNYLHSNSSLKTQNEPVHGWTWPLKVVKT